MYTLKLIIIKKVPLQMFVKIELANSKTNFYYKILNVTIETKQAKMKKLKYAIHKLTIK